jgi:hypothetical protein
MKLIIASCACASLVLGIATAHADGPGVVTWMLSQGGQGPYAEQFSTNHGFKIYCFSARDAGYQGELRSETLSYMTRNYPTNLQEPINFQEIGPQPDCPGGTTGVNRVQLGQ